MRTRTTIVEVLSSLCCVLALWFARALESQIRLWPAIEKVLLHRRQQGSPALRSAHKWRDGLEPVVLPGAGEAWNCIFAAFCAPVAWDEASSRPAVTMIFDPETPAASRRVLEIETDDWTIVEDPALVSEWVWLAKMMPVLLLGRWLSDIDNSRVEIEDILSPSSEECTIHPLPTVCRLQVRETWLLCLLRDISQIIITFFLKS